MFFQRFLRFFSQDIAMDLGTANTLLYIRTHGIVINEPSVVAIDLQKKAVIAVGAGAKQFLGRTPQGIRAVRPMKDGVIADFDVTHAMIAYFVRKAITGLCLVKPSMVICVPTGITQVEKKAVIDSALLAGAASISLVEEPMAAAIGADLPIHEPLGNMVLDIGGGTSEVAVITMAGTAAAQSVRVAGDVMNMAVQRFMRDVFRMDLGDNTAENVKIILGSAVPQPNASALEVSGKDLIQGTPKVVTVTEGHIREALREPVQAILNVVLRTLEKTPPELSADIYRNGMLMAGGGSLLKGLDQFIARETHLKVFVDKNPLTTVLRGTARAMLDRKTYNSVFIN
ncbi:rod shape-determining protein [Candidatus Desulfovibrio trichonymphae]|uniref:Cell shape-determining protein MreB n=1 Tax=Candidatus Desulfovibrio trichonymphae TaxID=1725232 RepID=A0A1J1E1K7_9BACT|nr:rod shape-determining protein [Candidatus Desulfovibrio trichonymphae]BAV91779.1 rod shape-determining protein MreB [Candidatus Desulfovibrio trichonymphae]GHU92497.1 rod shape-determining protein [Deltaproteobacteria bacterium]GHU93865.1 rod shape-determining protein [Deltaproteobacteria bacterium]GHV00067.1 rod shape-determining protein [Deltaproteobacteria bacterium]